MLRQCDGASLQRGASAWWMTAKPGAAPHLRVSTRYHRRGADGSDALDANRDFCSLQIKKPDVNTSGSDRANLAMERHWNVQTRVVFCYHVSKDIRSDSSKTLMTPNIVFFPSPVSNWHKNGKNWLIIRHTNVTRPSWLKVNPFWLWIYTMNNCNNKGDIDFWQRSKYIKAACICFNLSLHPSTLPIYSIANWFRLGSRSIHSLSLQKHRHHSAMEIFPSL